MTRKKDKHPAVHIVWQDSHSEQVWSAAKEIDDDITPVTSIGWLIKETEKTITISTSRTKEDVFADPLTIPKFAISKRRKLRL